MPRTGESGPAFALAPFESVQEAIHKYPHQRVCQCRDGYLAPTPLHRLPQQPAGNTEVDPLVHDEEEIGQQESCTWILNVNLDPQGRSREAYDGIGNAVHPD